MAQSVVNSFNNGMRSGVDPSIFPAGSYREMRNGQIFSRDENGFVVTNISAPKVIFELSEGFLPIGSTEFDGVLYIVSYNKDFIVGEGELAQATPMIEIGRYHDPDGDGLFIYEPLPILTIDDVTPGEYITGEPLRITKTAIGYSTDHLIEVFSRKSFDDSVNLYICDGVNTNIVINTGQMYVNTIESPLTINDVSQFKSINVLPIMSGEVIQGGYLKPGSYFVAIRYTTLDLNSTIFVNQIGPFVIADGNSINTAKGLMYVVGEPASRSISLSLDDLPADYKYFEIAIIHYFGENGAMSYETNLIANKFANDNIVIDGREQMMTITIEDLLADNLQYNRCTTHLQSQGRYFGANWKVTQDLHANLAALAARIVPGAVYKFADDTEMIMSATHRSYGIINQLAERKYKAGEIYPFAVSFIIDGKYQTEAYPICGYDSNIVYETTQLSMTTVRERVKNNIMTDAIDYTPNKGLFRFPFAMKTDRENRVMRRNLFYNMMGVNFDFTYYITHLNYLRAQPGVDINITGVILMQGKRIENCMAQGVNLPLIDRIAIEANTRWKDLPHNHFWHYASQVVALGDGKQSVYFPYLFNDLQNDSFVAGNVNTADAEIEYPNTNKFQFPVITFYGIINKFKTKYSMLGYVTPYFKSANFVVQNERIQYAGYQKHFQSTIKENNFFSQGPVSGNPSAANMVERTTYLDNSMQNIANYAFMSPDHNYGATKNLSGIMRTLQYLGRSITDGNFVYADSLNLKEVVGVSEPIRLSSMNNWNTYQKSVLYALRNMLNGNDKFSDSYAVSIIPSNGFTFVDELQVIPDEQGYITQMKSIFEVFGELGTAPNEWDQEYFINNIVGKSREKLTAAGIMLNLAVFKHSTQQEGWQLGNSNSQIQATFGDGESTAIGPFANYTRGDYFLIPATKNYVIPCFVTNMGMKSKAYYGYNSLEKIDSTRNLSDFISEIYHRDPETLVNGPGSEYECYAYFRDRFNNISENYSEIKLLNIIPTTTPAIYKGDVYAQMTTFRLNKYSMDLLNAGNYADDYRHGQVAQLYLESFKNHALRCTTIDDMFYPLCEKLGQNLLDYAYKNSTDRYKIESNTYNEGYHELQGLMVKNGIDIALPDQSNDKVNRVYWSDVYTDGAYEDAYRAIKTGQYADFNPELGEIHRIIDAGNYLFLIHDKGISQLYMNNKLENAEDGSSIILGDTSVLNPYAKILATFGTQHPQSVVQGASGIYGVDWAQHKVWFISMKVSDAGSYFYIAEDLLETKSLRTFFKDLDPSNFYGYKRLENILYGTDGIDFKGIVSGADLEHKKIYFTFHLDIGIDTLVFDEQQNMFTGFYDYKPNIYLPYRDKLFKFDKFYDQVTCDGTQLRKVWALEGEQNYSNFTDVILTECIQQTILTPVEVAGDMIVDLGSDTFTVALVPFDEDVNIGFDELTWVAYQLEQASYTPWTVDRVGRVVTFSKDATQEYEHSWGFENNAGVESSVVGFFRGPENPFKLVFYVNGLGQQNLSNVQKEFIVHKIFGSDNLFKNDDLREWIRRIQWETEYQLSELDLSGTDHDANDVDKFWKTPIFEDHMWNVPIDVQSSESAGPNGDGMFTTFDPGSTMRGSYLKVTITYSGDEKIFIKNCITNFIQSNS